MAMNGRAARAGRRIFSSEVRAWFIEDGIRSSLGEDDARADRGLSSEVVATHVRGLRDVGTANRGGGTYGVCVVLQTHGPWSLRTEVSCRANYALCAKSQL